MFGFLGGWVVELIFLAQALKHFFYVRGRRAAASADDRRACLYERGDVACEVFWADGEDRPAVDHLREPGVRLDGDGKGGASAQPPRELQHPVGAEAAVHAERVYPQPLEERGDAFDVRARQESSVVSQRDCRQDRERRVLLRGEDGGLQFVQVSHRLYRDEVGACRRADAHLLGERVVGGVELEVACGLQEPPGGADVERGEPPPAAGIRDGVARDGDSRRYDVGERRVAVVLGGVRAEGVRVDDVRPCGEVRFVHGPDVVRPRQVPELRDLSGAQSPCLELRAHRAVQEENPVVVLEDLVRSVHFTVSCPCL